GPTVASTATPVGSGTLTIRFGTVAGSAFTEDAGHPALNLTIPPGAKLADVAAAITSVNAGLSAYVANTVDGPRLVVKGQPGAANGFVLEATEDPTDPGLSQLAWNPATGPATQLLTGAQNAAYKLDGLAMTSPSNTVTGLVAGLDATFTATNAGAPATLSFNDNTGAITATMQDLTGALNELAGMVKTATDPLTGDLNSDPGAKALKRALSQLSGAVIMPNTPAGAPRTLSDLGLSIQRDGTFALDGARLTKALAADPTGVAAMFTNGLYGVYGTIDGLNRTMAATGSATSLAASIARYTKQKTQAASDLSALATKQEAFRQQLVTRFATTQTAVSASTSTLTFLKNQIDAWNSKN
ncbi:MAG: flagellar filament capping protein FliD, partial [Sphingomonadales bacterium]|nr:flagellar filament capping protein FliD [Sphingomonadales bacterium]